MIFAIRAYFTPGLPKPPTRNKRFLAFLRLFPCICCGSCRRIESAHFGPHAIGQKADDMDALPLCEACHRTGPKAYHKLGPVDFALVHCLDIQNLQEYFRGMWFRKQERKAA
jgi:hypothetical protein